MANLDGLSSYMDSLSSGLRGSFTPRGNAALETFARLNQGGGQGLGDWAYGATRTGRQPDAALSWFGGTAYDQGQQQGGSGGGRIGTLGGDAGDPLARFAVSSAAYGVGVKDAQAKQVAATAKAAAGGLGRGLTTGATDVGGTRGTPGSDFGDPTDQQVAAALPATSPLATRLAYVRQKATEYGVPVAWALAIAQKESQFGTVGGLSAQTGGNNYFGLTGTGTAGSNGRFAAYATPEDGIDAALRNMGSELYRGKSLRAFLLTYAPPGDGNDTEHYINDAVAFVNGLGGRVTPDSIPVGAPRPGPAPSPAPPGATGGGDLVARANQLLGTPYVLGGRRANNGDPTKGIDCSEYTAWVYERYGVALPWNANLQWNATSRVAANQLQVGDLVFFSGTNPQDPDPITHVGIYVGNGEMLDAENAGVKRSSLSDPYWAAHVAGYGRVGAAPGRS